MSEGQVWLTTYSEFKVKLAWVACYSHWQIPQGPQDRRRPHVFVSTNYGASVFPIGKLEIKQLQVY